jgi:propionyl-CoA carboxylase alpha chain
VTDSALLVANRGEIARRVIRSARDMGMRTIAVFVDADADALFVRDADTAVRLATGYLDADAVLAAAQRAGATALHPGYGFLSENAEFAARVQAAGLIWVGPPPAAISAMGDKLAAKALAERVGVPTLPYSHDPTDAAAVGFPLLVKASAGGGGKGMRVVNDAADLVESVAAAQREAASGFGDDTVFLERYVARSRHVEIQIFGDAHGHLVHLGERECSIQRRHQKIVEESPSPVVDDELRTAMGDAALLLARALDYQSAGTVEFLVDDETRSFYFLEVNTRLQVEHPVTEEVTGVDLVREQLRVAAGAPLSFTQDDLTYSGHAIEVRLCAEDPAAGYLPATGTIAAFAPAEIPEVRWESGVGVGSVIGVSFDPLLAKVISHAPTRAEAASRLALALEHLHLGGVTTNRDLLAAILRHESFLAGDTTTDFLERCGPSPQLNFTTTEITDAARTATLWLRADNRRSAPVLESVPGGWRNARLPAEVCLLRGSDGDIEVSYRPTRDGSILFDDVVGIVHRVDEFEIDVEIDGVRACRRVTRSGDQLYVQVDRGTIAMRTVSPFVVPEAARAAGSLSAPMPGSVLAVRVGVGEHVERGTILVILEAMKIEHQITAPARGVIAEVLVSVGQQVATGAELLVLEADDDG